MEAILTHSLFFKVIFVLCGFFLWHRSQSWIEARAQTLPLTFQNTSIDFTHRLTEKGNIYLKNHPKFNRVLLILSSLGVDLLALYILFQGFAEEGFRILLAFFSVFVLRQFSQLILRLAQPGGMIWFDPKFPSLFVTYKVSNDFFFSGHTALAVLGALNVFEQQEFPWGILALLVAVFEIIYVIVLRVHWFLDVWVGALVAATVFYFLQN